jgi:hypothetical protein
MHTKPYAVSKGGHGTPTYLKKNKKFYSHFYLVGKKKIVMHKITSIEHKIRAIK